MHWLLLCGIYGLLLVRAILDFQPLWDFLTYHLPAALKVVGKTTYDLQELYAEFIKGCPPLGHLIQAALIAVTGNIASSQLFSFVSLIVSLIGIKQMYRERISVRWLATSFLGIPLFILLLPTGYLDIGVATGLLLSFAALLHLDGGGKLGPSVAWYLAGMAFSFGGKFQAWPFAAIFSAGLVIVLAKRFLSRRESWKSSLLATVLVALFLGLWPIRNIVKFGNPTYPVQPPFIKTELNSPHPSSGGIEEWLGPEGLEGRPRPVKFLLSTFELTRWQNSETPFHYNWDMTDYPEGRASPHWRMGGWFFVPMLTGCTLLVLAIVSGAAPRISLVMLALAMLLTALSPASNYLRFWSFIPLCLLFIVVFTQDHYGNRFGLLIRIVLCVSAIYSVASTWTPPAQWHPLEATIPPGAREFWKEFRKNGYSREKPVYLGESVTPFGIYYAGRNFNKLPVTQDPRDESARTDVPIPPPW